MEKSANGVSPSTEVDAGIRRHGNGYGITIIELIITIVLLSITALLIAPIMGSGIKAWYYSSRTSLTRQYAEQTFDYLKAELAQADAITLAGTNELEYRISSSTYRWYADDYNNNGSPPGSAPYEIHRADSTASFAYGDGYPISGLIALKSDATPGLTFEYWNAGMESTATLAEIKNIKCTLTFSVHDLLSTYSVILDFEPSKNIVMQRTM